jgi:hypothetical protein
VSATGLYTTAAITGFLSLAAADTVDARFACDTGSRTFTTKHMNLTLLRVA